MAPRVENPVLIEIQIQGDLGEKDIDTPRTIVEKILNELTDETIKNVRYLIPKPKKPRFVDIHVRVISQIGSDCDVFFRMLRDSMYLIAFMSGKYQQWWELRDSDNVFQKFVDGANSLPLNGSYTGSDSIGTQAEVMKLVRNADKKILKSAIPYRNALVLNRKNTVDAIRHLYYYKDSSSKSENDKLARLMVYMVQVLAEMPRFDRIRQHVGNQWLLDEIEENQVYGEEITTGKATRLPDPLIELENRWKDIASDIQIKNDYDEVGELGIVIRVEKKGKKPEKAGPSSNRR